MPGTDRGDNALEIANHRVLAIVAVGRPFRVAMAAGIERHRVITFRAEAFGSATPGVTCLAATVKE
ncbi:hypothetical protein WT23_17865 [Burkholderia territorii]|nr:hypothetical protein WT23_17865 [Burkholderia territorii]